MPSNMARIFKLIFFKIQFKFCKGFKIFSQMKNCKQVLLLIKAAYSLEIIIL